MQPGAPPPPPPGSGYPPPGAGSPPGYGQHPGYGPPGGYGYPPGYGYPGYVPGLARPSGPKTLGILSIVFGSLVGLLALFGLLAGRSLAGGVNANQVGRAAFERYMDKIQVTSMLVSVVMLVMSIALIVIGNGQRKYLRKAVKQSVYWGIAALGVLALQLVIQFTVNIPALEALVGDVGGNHETRTILSTVKVVSVVGLLIYLPYPIILIAAFRKPAVVAAMDQPAEVAAATFQ